MWDNLYNKVFRKYTLLMVLSTKGVVVYKFLLFVNARRRIPKVVLDTIKYTISFSNKSDRKLF